MKDFLLASLVAIPIFILLAGAAVYGQRSVPDHVKWNPTPAIGSHP